MARRRLGGGPGAERVAARVVRVATLGSGSRGNSVLLESEETRILVDAGFSGAELARRLRGLGVEPEQIDALVVTHDHRDHTCGVGIAARRWGWPVYVSRPTAEACRPLLNGSEDLRPLRRNEPLLLGGVAVHPFLTCHDAPDPLAVTVTESSTRLKVGIATDLGRATVPVRHALAGCHFLILEANHDEGLLRTGPYPWPLKRRIGGSRGHLSNRLAGELAAELEHPRLGAVLLAHLSHDCNDPARARATVRRILGRAGFTGILEVAGQETPSPFFDVGALVARRGSSSQLDLFGDGQIPAAAATSAGDGRASDSQEAENVVADRPHHDPRHDHQPHLAQP
ncbi:MAG: MBL fold metallo-hydrolase [Gemmatimonadota bacterium]